MARTSPGCMIPSIASPRPGNRPSTLGQKRSVISPREKLQIPLTMKECR